MGIHQTTETDPLIERLAVAGSSAAMSLGAGAVSVVIGLLVLFWPGITLLVLAVLFAIQFIVAGALQIVTAFAADGGTGSRVLLGLLGALSILVGVLCLRSPLQTVVVLGLLIGSLWVVSGVVGIVHAVGAERGSGRGWAIVSGIVSIIGGVIVLVYPTLGLLTLTWLLGIVLVVNGIVMIVRGFTVNRARRAAERPATGGVGPGPVPTSP
jgi:uncharacterized membrane protein HdeD (DUF308 family)